MVNTPYRPKIPSQYAIVTTATACFSPPITHDSKTFPRMQLHPDAIVTEGPADSIW